MQGTLTKEEYDRHRGGLPSSNGATPPTAEPVSEPETASEPETPETAARPCAVCGGALPAGKRRYCSDDCEAKVRRQKVTARRQAAMRSASQPTPPEVPSRPPTGLAALVAQLLAADPTLAIDVELDGARVTVRRP